MKLGLDLHGVADTHYGLYGPLTQALLKGGPHQVHIITGRQSTPHVLQDLAEKGMVWTHWFSIAQHHLDLDDGEVWFDDDGKPWMKPEVWDPAKSLYCEREQIDIHIDDSPVYGRYFTGNCLYLLQKDLKHQDIWTALAEKVNEK